MQRVHFMFFGRLEREKGFDTLLDAIRILLRNYPRMLEGMQFIICGDGSLGKDLRELIARDHGYTVDLSMVSSDELIAGSARILDIPESIVFLGWQDRRTVFHFLKQMHYTIMPSRFLETFGLVALESLTHGVPVIGYAKGGLTAFISETFRLADERPETLVEMLLNITRTSTTSTHIIHCEAALATAAPYAQHLWLRRFHTLLPDGARRILLITDYLAPVGGTESHVRMIAHALRACGYEVEIYGWDTGASLTRSQRLLGLFMSFRNRTCKQTLAETLDQYRPDVVWCHSVSRFLGPHTLQSLRGTGAYTMMTHHDIAMTPFASVIEQETDIPRIWTRTEYMTHIHSYNPLKYLYAWIKFMKMDALRDIVRTFDRHIIPSEFLRPIVGRLYDIPDDRITLLPHCIEHVEAGIEITSTE